MNRSLLKIPAALVLLVPVTVPGAPAEEIDSFYVDYSKEPKAEQLLAYDLCILSPEAEADLKPGQELGTTFLAYLSLVEVAEDAPYRDAMIRSGIPVVGRNPNWNSELVDVSNAAWKTFVLEKLAAPALEKGYDGFFLDTADSLSTLAEAHPDRAADSRAALLDLIRELRKRFPKKRIVINRGFDLLPDLSGSVDGVLVESVFRTFDPDTRKFEPVEPETNRILRDRIAATQKLGLPVYVLDYVAPDDKATAEKTAGQIREIDCTPFLTTPELQGTISGAAGLVARRILVLFGHDPAEAETSRIWPADTTAHGILQMPLEWMGYELDYHDVSKGLPPFGDGDEYAGVILDEELEFPFRLEEKFADWLIDRVDDGKKLLFLGSYTFAKHQARQKLFSALGIGGEDDLPRPLGPPEFAAVDKSLMNFEAEAHPSRRDFENLAAPENARILVSIQASENADGSGETQQYDAAYLAHWGGALLSPYVLFEASEETMLQYADPFALLGEIWPGGKFPAPDNTTRDGLRLFYTHIDGDGFSSGSAVEPGKNCAEVLYDRVLKKLPWPITVSVVEAETRGHLIQQKPDVAGRLEEMARKIFRLPQVEPASHSYSHPYLWIEDDTRFMGLYDELNLKLKLTARYPEIDVEREIDGSMDYINRELAPATKPARLMLWSGDCRPSPEALARVESLGFENLNGGNTILSRRYPGLFAVAPRVVSWDGHLQIYSANQNEFLYTDGWSGPFYGGFAQVIETFEMTETPRRLKPVNVYYHFYSAERPDALSALEKIYNWCRGQKLHAVTASEFAALTRDAHNTRLMQTGARTWIALNRGAVRTFRLPAELGLPDIAASDGITGFRKEGDSIYLHTDGGPRTRIVLADRPQLSPYLENSDAALEFSKTSARNLHLRAKNRTAHLRLAGFTPGASITIAPAGNTARTMKADPSGRLELTAPARVLIEIREEN